METETSLPDNMPELPPAPPRESLIATAVKFLGNPKVADSPLEQKKQFLVKKGLTDEEIQIAVSRAGVSSEGGVAVAVPPAAPPQSPMQPVSTWTRIKEYSALAIIIGGVVYGLYTLYKRFIEPIFIRASKAQEEKLQQMEEGVRNVQDKLGENMQEIRTTMNELQDQVTAQNVKLSQVAANLTSYKTESGYSSVSNSAIGELKAEITSIKGLLLSRNQFPSQPPARPIIPSWQMKPTPSEPSGSDSQNSSPLDEDSINGVHQKDAGNLKRDGGGDGESDIVHGMQNGEVNGYGQDADKTQADNSEIPSES